MANDQTSPRAAQASNQPFYREIEFDRAKLNAEERTVPVAFSSEHPVDRGDFDEVLDHAEGMVDLSRLNDGAALLLNHDPDKQIGVVESAKVEGDRKGRALIRFGRSQLASEIFQDVKEGIRKHMSVGYERLRVVASDAVEGGRRVVRFAWRPFELSVVPVPADPNVGVGRNADSSWKPIDQATDQVGLHVPGEPDDGDEDDEGKKKGKPAEGENAGTVVDPNPAAKVDAHSLPTADADSAQRQSTKSTDMAENNNQTATAATPAATVNVEEVRTKALESERNRTKNIRAAADKVSKDFPEGANKFRELADAAIDAGTTPENFNADLLAAMPGVRKATMITAESLGMSQRDVNQYSIGRAIQSVVRRMMSGGGSLPDGLEGEVHKAMEQRMKSMPAGVSNQGFWVPHDIGIAMGTRTMTRDLNVTTAGQGGNFVQTSILTPIIEILRNRMIAKRLGVQSMAGLEGNIAIPRQTGAATAYTLAESATLTKSTQAIDQVLVSPHRVGATNTYTKQLLLQSSVDVENFIRDDLMKVLAIKWDKLILEGTGSASEPRGVLHTEAIGSVTFGTTATWAKVLEFETSLAAANADLGKMAYATTPTTRGKWKQIPKVTSSTFPIFLWEKGDWADGTNDGEVNSYRAACTNQIAGNCVAFGNWEDCIQALWGGYDVVVNPYAGDVDATVRITVNTFGDVAVRHAASFCWSTDSGAQ